MRYLFCFILISVFGSAGLAQPGGLDLRQIIPDSTQNMIPVTDSLLAGEYYQKYLQLAPEHLFIKTDSICFSLFNARDTICVPIDTVAIEVGGGTDTDVDSVALIGSTLHIYEDDKDRSVDLSGLQTSQDTQSLVVINDTTIGLTFPNSSVVKDTVFFSFDLTGINETYADSATYIGDTLTIFRKDTTGSVVDSFKVEVIGGRDTYVDSAAVTTVAPLDSIWFFRDSLGVNIDSFLVVLNDSIVPDTQSLSIDTTTALFTLSRDPTTTPDLLVLPWQDAIRSDYSANFNDTINHAGFAGIGHGDSIPDYPLTVYGSSGNGQLRLQNLGAGNAAIVFDHGNNLRGRLSWWGSHLDFRDNAGRQIFRLDTMRNSLLTSHLIWLQDTGQVSFGAYGQGYMRFPNDDLGYVAMFTTADGGGDNGEIQEVGITEFIDTLEANGIGSSELVDFDFIQVPDTSIVGLAGRIPLDSTDIDTIIYRSGAVIVGDSVNRATSYKEGYALLDTSDPLLNINGQRNAVDLYDLNAVELYLRNRQADFVLRNHNDDPLIFNDTLETHFELAVNSYLNPDDTVSFREPFRISSRATDRALNIGQEYIRLADYGTGQDTLVKDSVLAVLVPDATGKLHRVSRDTLNAALNIAASAPQEIDTFSIVNDSLLLDLTNTVGGIQRVDLSKYVNDTTYITGDSLIVGDSIYNLPQGADSLGTAFSNNYLLLGDGTRSGKTDSLIYNPSTYQLGIGSTSLPSLVGLHSYRPSVNLAVIEDGGAAVQLRLKSSANNRRFLGVNSSDAVLNQILFGDTYFEIWGASNSYVLEKIHSTTGAIQWPQYDAADNVGVPTYLLGTDASGNVVKRAFTDVASDIGAQSGTEIYGSSFGWNTGTGVLTLNRTGSTAITVDLDGRYLTSEVDGSTSNELQTFGHSHPSSSQYTLSLSNLGGSLQLNAGSGISFSPSSGGAVTINSTAGGYTSWSTGTTTASMHAVEDGDRVIFSNAGDINPSRSQSTVGGLTTSTYTFNIGAGTVGTSELANSAVTSDKILNGAVGTDDIANSDIFEIDLAVTNVPIDNYLLSYDASGGGFTWVAPGGGVYSGSGTISSGTVATVAGSFQLNGGFSLIEIQTDDDIVISNSGTGDDISISAQDALLLNGGTYANFSATDVGIRRVPSTNDLEVSGTASKGTAGDWLANSDRRLKKNIKQLAGKDAIDKLLILKGVNYEWNEKSKTLGYDRPDGKQWGLIAQDIRKAFGDDPHFTQKDGNYYNAAYGTYDPLYIESFRYLKEENDDLKATVAAQKNQIDQLQRMFFNLQQQVKELQDASKK